MRSIMSGPGRFRRLPEILGFRKDSRSSVREARYCSISLSTVVLRVAFIDRVLSEAPPKTLAAFTSKQRNQNVAFNSLHNPDSHSLRMSQKLFRKMSARNFAKPGMGIVANHNRVTLFVRCETEDCTISIGTFEWIAERDVNRSVCHTRMSHPCNQSVDLRLRRRFFRRYPPILFPMQFLIHQYFLLGILGPASLK